MPSREDRFASERNRAEEEAQWVLNVEEPAGYADNVVDAFTEKSNSGDSAGQRVILCRRRRVRVNLQDLVELRQLDAGFDHSFAAG